MTDMQKLAYDATLQRLREAFPDNPEPYISQMAKYLKRSMYALLADKEFRRLTFGKSHKRVSLENVAAWKCKAS